MEAGDNQHGTVIFGHEKQRVGEATQGRAPHILENHRELPGIIAHAFDQGVHRLSETPSQASYFPFVPVLRLNQLGAAGLGEEDRML